MTQAKLKQSLEEALHEKEEECVRQAAELDKLRHDVVRFSAELGKQRGRAEALSTQAQEVRSTPPTSLHPMCPWLTVTHTLSLSVPGCSTGG